MFDGEEFGNQMVEIVRGYVAAEIEPLRAENKALTAENKSLAERIAAIEARAMPEAIKGDPGEVDMAAVDAIIAEKVADAVAALPPAEKGEPGADGCDVDMDDVQRRIDQAVKSAADALPAPKEGAPGKDGIGLASALIDRDGALVVTFSNGESKSLGVVVGRDGVNGKDGETFTLDDFDIVPLDERSIKLCFTRGEAMHSFELSFPVPLDAGVWREDGEYAKGDGVTWAGSYWIAQRDAPGKPDATDSGWRLSVKRGRDGKDAK